MAKKRQESEKSLTVRQPRAGHQMPARRFDDIFGQPFFPRWWRGFMGEEAAWAPPIHILEKEDNFVAKVELPGVHEEDVSVSVVGDMLVVEGEKQAESEVKKKGYSYSETSYGSFSRSITIPSTVDADKISASFDKGVLEIDLPKAVQIKPKKINVTAKKKAKTAGKETKAASGSKEETSKTEG
ncbi:MAG: Hsp20/alpha crystallin family protein [Nitrososphaerota archaeon]|nr:Hsp20/alpha crystallin family protein [Nitrososphaerota archaeon]